MFCWVEAVDPCALPSRDLRSRSALHAVQPSPTQQMWGFKGPSYSHREVARGWRKKRGGACYRWQFRTFSIKLVAEQHRL